MSRFIRQQSDQCDEEALTDPGTELTPSILSNDYVFLDLDYLFDQTSRIYRAYFGVVYGPAHKIVYFPDPLVLKMARDDREGDSLKLEYKNYQGLGSKGVIGIAKCYGLFSCRVNSRELRYFLLLGHGGEPISKRSNLSAHTKKHRYVNFKVH